MSETSENQKKPITYKDSGVDIKAGEELVDSIKELVSETHSARVLSNIGGFGGLFSADFTGYREPVLVSSVDGVGTKLIVAFNMEIYDTVGQDLVNHCVNDIAVCGAEPLFFLDYFSTGKLDKGIGYDVIKGFTIACRENGVALIGGETAEMPDIYKEGEFDLAGTIVGVVDREKLITGKSIQKGDKLLGFKSTGLHTNGFSLARKVLFSTYHPDDLLPGMNQPLGMELLSVHKSYLSLIRKLKETDGIHGFSHITGGGIIGNTKRILNEGQSLKVNWNSWERPALFNLIQETGNVPEEDMRSAFNLGIGLIAVCSPDSLKQVTKICSDLEEPFIEIGEVV
ncbi:MAG: phosphoribosylformylglycinamidine cyclo-ligase [Balneolaceae bacterium]|nr:MAG: phosphoribosylformylglycinamidine cyclo-ligase [Balneolaceae bacterium]